MYIAQLTTGKSVKINRNIKKQDVKFFVLHPDFICCFNKKDAKKCTSPNGKKDAKKCTSPNGTNGIWHPNGIDDYRSIIDRRAEDGWRYVGCIPTKQRGTGHTQEMDLIFEKEVIEGE